jgi:3-phenylpropionate/trans-cinnamate dioxygenase ferredoxin reductase subunit
MTSIVIIGAGECGVRAAFALRENGFSGSVTVIGDEVEMPYERPPLSKSKGQTPKLIRSAQAFDDVKIMLLRGVTVTTIEPKNRLLHLTDGTKMAYDQVLMATGSRPRILPAFAGCVTLRTARDAAQILPTFVPKARVCIIGGGFIGLELAATAVSAGADVTVIEAAPRTLGRAVPEQIALRLQARHIQEGVRLLTGVGISRATATQVHFEDGTQADFDVVIAGIGAVPNVERATDARLAVDNGITVDAHFRTSDSAIFAAGDCCNATWRGARIRLESWTAAQDQGAHAAAAMLGATEPYSKVPWFWSDQYDLTLFAAGIFDFTRQIHTRDTAGAPQIVFQCDAQGCVCAAAGLGVGTAAAKDMRIFEKLIARMKPVDADTLADQSVNLKRLLR